MQTATLLRYPSAGFLPSFRHTTFVHFHEPQVCLAPSLVLSPLPMFRETLKDARALLQTQAHLVSQDMIMAVSSRATALQTHHQPVSMQSHRFHLLDALRGVAAMLVVLYHSPLELQTRFHFPNSYLAVDFFFCLSGFVVAYSYEDRLRQQLRLSDFAVLRLVRLYPLFALSMALAALRTVISPLKLHDLHSGAELGTLIFTSFLLIPNAFVHGLGAELFPLNAPAWSLFLELIANAVFALSLRHTRAPRLLAGLYLASLLALCLAVHGDASLDFGAEWHGFGFGLARVGTSFLAGVALLHLFRFQAARPLRAGLSLGCAAVAVISLVGCLTLSTRITQHASYSLFAALLLFPAIIYLSAHCALPASLHDLCAALGDLSYPLYILHVPLMLPYHNLFALALFRTHPNRLPYLVFVNLALLLPLCWWVNQYLDLPLRRRLTTAYRNALSQPALREAPLRPHL